VRFVAGNVMKALICTLVDDAVHCLTDDDELEERVHIPFRDNTDRNKMDMTCSCHDEYRLTLALLEQTTVDFESLKRAIERRFDSSEVFPVHLAVVSADYYHSSQLELQLCSDVVRSL
jgi:hypothetical protein